MEEFYKPEELDALYQKALDFENGEFRRPKSNFKYLYRDKYCGYFDKIMKTDGIMKIDYLVEIIGVSHGTVHKIVYETLGFSLKK